VLGLLQELHVLLPEALQDMLAIFMGLYFSAQVLLEEFLEELLVLDGSHFLDERDLLEPPESFQHEAPEQILLAGLVQVQREDGLILQDLLPVLHIGRPN